MNKLQAEKEYVLSKKSAHLFLGYTKNEIPIKNVTRDSNGYHKVEPVDYVAV